VHVHDDPAGVAGHVAAADAAQVRPGQASAGAQADQPGRAHPPRHRGLRVSQREIAVDLRRAVRRLGPLAGQRRIRRGQCRDHLPGQEPQVGPQRPPRRAGQARRRRGEPLDPELDKALAYLREGDVLVITRLSRAMRSLKHLLALADGLRERGVGLVVLKQQIDTTTPTGRLVFHILGAIDEFQRELIIEGTREGLDAARARGRTGGRKPKLNARQAATVRRMYQATGLDGKRQHTVAEIAEAVGVHRTTVYDYLNKES